MLQGGAGRSRGAAAPGTIEGEEKGGVGTAAGGAETAG